MRIDSTPTLVTSTSPAAAPVAAPEGQQEQAKSVRELGQGIKVTLSEQAQARAASSNKDQAVADSDLPDTIKSLIEHIRELKAQIAAKQTELAALQRAAADPEQVKQVQQQLSSLTSALTTAYASLATALDDDSLSDDQKMAALNMSIS